MDKDQIYQLSVLVSFIIFWILLLILGTIGFTYINDYYHNLKNPDPNITLIYNLNLSWFILFWLLIVFTIIMFVVGVSIENENRRLGNNIITASIITLIIDLVMTMSLMIALVVEISKGSHQDPLYTPFVLIITSIVLIFPILMESSIYLLPKSLDNNRMTE